MRWLRRLQGLAALPSGRFRLRACDELGEGSLAGLEHGIAQLPEALRARVALHAGSAGSHAGLVAGSDLVIADPPRKGLDPALEHALLATPPDRFVYVSCDIESFLRDAAALEPALQLTLIEAYDLFPHTEHLETLAVNNSYAQDDWVRWGSSTQARASTLRGHELRFGWALDPKINVLVRAYVAHALTTVEDGKRVRVDFNYAF